MRIIAHIGATGIAIGDGTTGLNRYGAHDLIPGMALYDTYHVINDIVHPDTSPEHTPASDPMLKANQALIENMQNTLDKSGTTDAANTMYSQANKIHQALISSGISEPAASYATYQSWHETKGWPKSYALYWQHNNGSGVKYAGQHNAVKLPHGYAGFTDFSDWIASFVHELKKKANPAGAKSLEDFAHRLKQNGYYGDSEENYLKGLKRARLVLSTMPAADNAYGNPAAGTPEWEQWIKDHKVITGVAAAAFLLLLLTR